MLKEYVCADLKELQYVTERNYEVKMYRVTIYTVDKLANIKQLASKYNFKDISDRLGLEENYFLNPCKNHSEFSKAIDREAKLRGAQDKDKYIKKLLDATKRGRNKVECAVEKKEPKYFVSNNALGKFKKEFEADK